MTFGPLELIVGGVTIGGLSAIGPTLGFTLPPVLGLIGGLLIVAGGIWFFAKNM